MAGVQIPRPDEIVQARLAREKAVRDSIDQICGYAVIKLEKEFKGYNCVFVNVNGWLSEEVIVGVRTAFEERGWTVVVRPGDETTFGFSRASDGGP